MKKQKKQNRYQEKVDWDDMTVGELSHHIGKKMTEKVVKSKRTYSRKTKHKKNKKEKISDGQGYEIKVVWKNFCGKIYIK